MLQSACQHKNADICRHLNESAYMPAYWYVDIYVGIWTFQHIYQHSKKKCVDIYVGIFLITSRMYWNLNVLAHICQHLDVSAYMSASGYVNIFASTISNILTYIGAYFSSQICVGILMCWHVWRHLNMPTYSDTNMNVDTLGCWHKCRHMSALCVDIWALYY